MSARQIPGSAFRPEPLFRQSVLQQYTTPTRILKFVARTSAVEVRGSSFESRFQTCGPGTVVKIFGIPMGRAADPKNAGPRYGLIHISHHELRNGSLDEPRQCAKQLRACMRSFGVRQLAAAFSPASLLAATLSNPTCGTGIGCAFENPRASSRVRKRQQAAALQSFAHLYRPWNESGATIIGRVCGFGTSAPPFR